MANNEILLKLKAISDFSDVQGNVKTLQKYLTNLKLPNSITKNLGKEFDELDKELQKFQSHINSGFKNKSDITGLEKSGKKIAQLFSNIENTIEGIDTTDLKEAFQIDVSELKEANKLVNSLKEELAGKIKSQFTVKINGEEKVVKLNESVEKLFKNSSAKQRLINFKNAIDTGDIESAKKQLEDLQTYAGKMFGETSVKGNAFKVALLEIKAILDDKTMGDSFSDLANRIKEAQEIADKTKTNFDDLRETAATALVGGIKEMSQGLGEYRREVESSAQSQQKLNSEIGQIKDQVSHYFSLINAAQLLRRAFQDVYNTVKELDAVMTETAVVTDFSVGDMWDKLPEYTAQAKALGVATKELYAATTLYYQQGLDTNASMAAGIETMKMAKIAGMEAADATDAMTAALRGFNMEVNETNAQRVNDVYSKLAAITASDTEEIATAMSKTASIASAVGAEFENIAVFLAQGIETTRESADSIGTALKTVLARFNELTKDPAEIGEIDGEIVDANKVEKALRSVGIALTDTNGQFRDADQVLLEVAQKWDTMSIMQQRYIATQAAGSRQQSRFIAMMSDYNRTMELQTAAYNAEGAAQAQYEKTLESLESKLNKLKDTWDEFILGIANSDVIKGAVDFLSDLLDVINKMTNAPGILGGVLKSLLAIGVFKGGKALIGKGSIGERLFDATQIAKAAAQGGRSASEAFREAFEKSAKKKDNKNILKTFEEIFQKKKWVGQLTTSKKMKIFDFSEMEKAKKTLFDLKEAKKELNAILDDNGNILPGIDVEDYNYLNSVIDESTENSKKYQSVIEMSGKATKASTSQINAYNAARSKGLTVQQASILLTSKGTFADFKAAAAAKLGAEATEEEVEALAKKIMAEKVANTTTSMGILTKAKYIALLLIGTKETRVDAAAKLAEAGATWAAKIAQDGFNSALLACPIGWYAAGILTIAAAFTGLIIAAKYFSVDAQLDRATKSAERSEKALENVKTQIQELNDSILSIKETRKSLDEIVKGTREFKQAVTEANQEVLQLIEQYPKLANYASFSRDGILEISSEGYDFLEQGNAEKIQTSANMLLGSQLEVSNLTAAKELKQLNDKLMAYSDKAGTGSLTFAKAISKGIYVSPITYTIGEAWEIEGLADAFELISKTPLATISGPPEEPYFATGGLNAQQSLEGILNLKEAEEGFAELGSLLGLTGEEFKALSGDIADYLRFRKQEEEKRLLYAEEYLRTIASEDLSKSIVVKPLIKIYAKDLVDQENNQSYGQQLETKRTEIDTTSEKEAFAERLNSTGQYGYITTSKLNEKETARQIYKAITGEDASSMTLSELEIEIAKFKIEFDKEESSEAINQIYEKIQTLSDSQQKDLEIILNGELDISSEDLEKVFNFDGSVNVEWLDELKKQYEETYGIAVDKMYDLIEAKKKFQEAESSKENIATIYQNFSSEDGITDNQSTLETLKEMGGIYKDLGNAAHEWTTIANEGAITQSAYLTSLYLQQKQIEESNRQAAISEREKIQSQIEALEKKTTLTAIEKEDLEKLNKQLRNTDWAVEIDIKANIEEVTSQVENFVSSLEKVGEVLTDIEDTSAFTFEEVESLVDLFGHEILEGYKINEEGNIKLNNAIIENAGKTAEEELTIATEKHKRLIDYQIAEVEGKIAAKELEIKIVEKAINSEDAWEQAAVLTQLANQEGVYQEIAQMENDSIANNKAALDAKNNNQEVYADGEVDINEQIAEKADQIYQKDVKNDLESLKKKTWNWEVFAEGLRKAMEKIWALDWEGAKNELKNAFLNASEYTLEEIDVGAIEDTIDSSKIKDRFDPVYTTDGELDIKATLQDFLDESRLNLAELKNELKGLNLLKVEIDSGLARSLNKIKNPGKLNENEKDKDFDYDEYFNQQQKLAKLQIERNKLEKDYEKILKAEIVDLKKLEENQKAQLENLQQQRDTEEKMQNSRINRMNQLENENPNFARALWYDDELGTLQINEDEMAKIANMSAEDIEAFEKYYEKMTEHNDAQLESRSNLLDIDGDILEITERGTSQLDKSFNTLEKIEACANRIKEIEAKIEEILSSVNIDAEQLSDAYEDQLATLEEQIDLWENIKQQRQEQYDDLINSDEAQQYFSQGYVVEIEPGVFEINQEKFNSANTETQNAITGFVEKMNTASDNLIEATTNVRDYSQQRRDTYQKHLDNSMELFSEVRTLLQDQYQGQIDALTNIDDSINEANEKLMDSISKSLSEQRQQRDNEKTEQDIADTEARLVYLKSDTTGANDLEIKNLEKQLEEKKEDYTDTLIDQKISELQQQNDEAAAQRQVQIELAQAQLDQHIRSGNINADVETLLKNGIVNGVIQEGSALYNLLTNSEGYLGMSEEEQKKYLGNINTNVASYQTIKNGVPVNIAFAAGSEIEGNTVLSSLFSEAIKSSGLTQSQQQTLSSQMSNVSLSANKAYDSLISAGLTDEQARQVMQGWQTNGNSETWLKKELANKGVANGKIDGITTSFTEWANAENEIYKLLEDWGVGDQLKTMMSIFTSLSTALTGYNFSTDKEGNLTISNPKGTETVTVGGMVYDTKTGQFKKKEGENITLNRKSNYTPEVARAILKYGAKTISAKELQKVLSKHGLSWEAADINGDGKINASDARGALRLAEGMDQLSDPVFNTLCSALGGSDENAVKKIFKNAGVKYETGGLADFTGPAWLDGTKSKPEMVLNAQDTQNFIQLKDILSQVLKGVGTVNTDGKTGDTYYEIHIDVEKMASDYDVDDVAERVKTIITQDAMYRNNNTINRLR